MSAVLLLLLRLHLCLWLVLLLGRRVLLLLASSNLLRRLFFLHALCFLLLLFFCLLLFSRLLDRLGLFKGGLRLLNLLDLLPRLVLSFWRFVLRLKKWSSFTGLLCRHGLFNCDMLIFFFLVFGN